MTGGIVYLVGAGPGDPDLITVAGLKRLRQAEVVVYDRLVHGALLDAAPPAAERIDVGKTPGHPGVSQADINALLVRHARAGKVVVRLKGGDPFVFGRGGEEAAACAAAGVPWAVVPGLSSVLAVPAAAGIPLTLREVAGAFAVVTAHRAEGAGRVDWAALARVDTLVILMGVEHLAETAATLRRHGRAADTPVAVIERGTWPDERVVAGTLADVADRAAAAGIAPPAVIVVGEVVRWCERMRQGAAEP